MDLPALFPELVWHAIFACLVKDAASAKHALCTISRFRFVSRTVCQFVETAFVEEAIKRHIFMYWRERVRFMRVVGVSGYEPVTFSHFRYAHSLRCSDRLCGVPMNLGAGLIRHPSTTKYVCVHHGEWIETLSEMLWRQFRHPDCFHGFSMDELELIRHEAEPFVRKLSIITRLLLAQVPPEE